MPGLFTFQTDLLYGLGLLHPVLPLITGMDYMLFISQFPISSLAETVFADNSLKRCSTELLNTRTMDRDRLLDSFAQYWCNFPP
jgi:hypothetical protein